MRFGNFVRRDKLCSVKSIGTLTFSGVNQRTTSITAVLAIALAFAPISSQAQTNSWANPNSGRWDDAAAWSLGILPDISQSVWITNNGAKSVTIDDEAASNSLASMSVGSLILAGTNTLVIDQIGTSNGFIVENGLTVNAGAAVWSVDSTTALLGSPALYLAGGSFYQDGGSVYAQPGCIFAGDYFLIEGDANFPFIQLDSGTIQQFAGNVTATILYNGGTYYQHGGNLTVAIGPYYFGGNIFVQDGGTNVVTGRADGVADLWLYSGFEDSQSRNWQLNGGTLLTSNAHIFYGGLFAQTGGTFVITNLLTILGTGDERGHPVAWTYGRYLISGGTLQAGAVQLNNGAGVYGQTGGSASVAGDFQFVGSTGAIVGALSLSDGTLMCSNLLYAGGVTDIEQSGGNLVVSNLLAFDGYFTGYQYYSFVIPPRFVRYDFTGGTLNAQNIELSAEWIIGSSTNVGRITNSGYFQTSGILDIGNAQEQLGRFILASNAIINFTAVTTTLSFADSHAESWSAGTSLNVSNWNGSISGGGAHQLKFGTSSTSLTAAQVNQIRFVNPGGFPAGTYAAKILNTGEVVPNAPTLSAMASSDGLIISWPDNSYVLQSATDVLGPWTNVVGAVSPFTNTFADGPWEFFRLGR